MTNQEKVEGMQQNLSLIDPSIHVTIVTICDVTQRSFRWLPLYRDTHRRRSRSLTPNSVRASNLVLGFNRSRTLDH